MKSYGAKMRVNLVKKNHEDDGNCMSVMQGLEFQLSACKFGCQCNRNIFGLHMDVENGN